MSDGPITLIAIKISFWNAKLFVPRTVEPSFKELEIETDNKMEIVFLRLLNFATNVTLKSFIVMYLNHPPNVAERYTYCRLSVHFDGSRDSRSHG